MKEQIEEMRKDLIEIFDEEYEKRRMITPDFTAEKMTSKGYRKQSDVIDEFVDRLKKILGCNDTILAKSICDIAELVANKMKGGAE